MVEIKVSSLEIGGRSYNKDKSGYPTLPTVFSGLEITWGAPSCIEHPEPSRATISLWVPKTHEDFVPTLGEVVLITGGPVVDEGQVFVTLFKGKVENVKLQDDHDVNGGYRINVVAADALAEAARLRLADSMWPFQSVTNRLIRITDIAEPSGVTFSSSTPDGGFIPEAADTYVRARDVDSFPALEAFQRAAMAAGSTVISSNGIVRPASSLNLPLVLEADDTGASVTYNYTGIAFSSTSVQKTGGTVTRTNYATNIFALYSSTNFSVDAGTGGVASFGSYSLGTEGDAIAPRKPGAGWDTASTGGTPALKYTETTSGASGSKVSVGVRVGTNAIAGKSFKVRLSLYNGSTLLGSQLSASTYVPAGSKFVYIKVENYTAPSAYTKVEVAVEAQSNMTLQETIYTNGIVIEKATTAPAFFHGYSVGPDENILTSEVPGLVTVSSHEIVDTAFELDTTKVINEIKVEMKRFIGSVGEPGWEASDTANQQFDQVFTDEAGSRKTTPQTRSIATDWAIRDAYMDDELPTSAMVTKGKLLIAGQSRADWRLSGSMELILSEVAESYDLVELISDKSRFGALIKISDAPTRVTSYMRIHAGRLVLGESPTLELEVESVEYSAPLPLTGNTLQQESIGSNYKLRNFKTMTANDLRAIGAR